MRASDKLQICTSSVKIVQVHDDLVHLLASRRVAEKLVMAVSLQHVELVISTKIHPGDGNYCELHKYFANLVLARPLSKESTFCRHADIASALSYVQREREGGGDLF